MQTAIRDEAREMQTAIMGALQALQAQVGSMQTQVGDARHTADAAAAAAADATAMYPRLNS
eukprot:2653499-Prymnesium_polylepis.1